MLKVFVPIFLLALLVVLPGNSRAMVGDNDWAHNIPFRQKRSPAKIRIWAVCG